MEFSKSGRVVLFLRGLNHPEKQKRVLLRIRERAPKMYDLVVQRVRTNPPHVLGSSLLQAFQLIEG